MEHPRYKYEKGNERKLLPRYITWSFGKYGRMGCPEALKQINDRNYEEKLIDDGMTTIYNCML